jgi:hypothetical protein
MTNIVCIVCILMSTLHLHSTLAAETSHGKEMAGLIDLTTAMDTITSYAIDVAAVNTNAKGYQPKHHIIAALPLSVFESARTTASTAFGMSSTVSTDIIIACGSVLAVILIGYGIYYCCSVSLPSYKTGWLDALLFCDRCGYCGYIRRRIPRKTLATTKDRMMMKL